MIHNILHSLVTEVDDDQYIFTNFDKCKDYTVRHFMHMDYMRHNKFYPNTPSIDSRNGFMLAHHNLYQSINDKYKGSVGNALMIFIVNLCNFIWKETPNMLWI